MKPRACLLVALLASPALGFQEEETEPADPLLEEVDGMLEDARTEIREFRQDGGEEGDPENPAWVWSERLWEFRGEHPGTRAADKATVEAVHFLIHADGAEEAVELALSVPDSDSAWERLIDTLFEAAETLDRWDFFVAQARELSTFEFDPEKKARMRFRVAQAHWMEGRFEQARTILGLIMREDPTREWKYHVRAARDELGHPEIRDGERSWRSPRDLWQRPGRIMEALVAGRRDRVADIGSGGGYFSFLLARRVGPEGRVYAVDIDEGSLERLEEEAAELGLEQIETVLGEADDPRLPAGELAGALLVDTYHEVRGYEGVLAGVFEALRPGGHLVIVDPPGEPAEDRTEYHRTHNIPAEVVIAEAEAAGFRLERHVPRYVRQPGGREYFLVVFAKPTPSATGG